MKSTCFILFLFLAISCNEKKDKPFSKDTPATHEVKDSDMIKRQMANPYSQVDVSPMDMAYYPLDYTVQKMTGQVTELPVARVIYSRPHRQGRSIFGGLLKYGEPWRLGANEATEIEFFKSVTIQNKQVQKGRYILYCIPQEKHWTIIFNSNLYTWGLKPDSSKDLFKFDIPVNATPSTLEYFTMTFEKVNDGANLLMAWENVVGRLPLQF